MTLQEVVADLSLKVLSGHDKLQQSVTGGYASDLLSNVMGQAKAGFVWITMQGHQNIVAVASLIGLTAVIIAGDASIESQTIEKAEKEGIVLLSTSMSVFDVCGLLHSLGIKGQ